jgi:hypothetical protein
MGINGEEAKAKILSLTVLSVSSIAPFLPKTAQRPRVWRRIDP